MNSNDGKSTGGFLQHDASSWLALIMANFLWAVVYVLAKSLFDRFMPMEVAFLRFSVAGLVWLVILVVFFRRHLSWALWRSAALPGLVSIVLYNLFYFPGLSLTLATHAVVITPGLGPAITALLNHQFNKTAITRIQALGILISFLGVVSLMAESFSFGTNWRQVLLGDMILLGCTLCWSSYTLLIRRAMEHGGRPLPLTGAGSFLGAFVLCAYIAITSPTTPAMLLQLTPHDWVNGFVLGVLGTVVPYLLWNFALRRLGTVKSTIFLNFLPIFGTLMSVFWLGEQPTVLLPLALLLVIIGVILTQNSEFLLNFCRIKKSTPAP